MTSLRLKNYEKHVIPSANQIDSNSTVSLSSRQQPKSINRDSCASFMPHWVAMEDYLELVELAELGGALHGKLQELRRR